MTMIQKRVLLVALLLAASLTFWLSCGGDSSSEPAPCFTLTTETVGFGSIDVSPDSACYHSGTAVNLVAIPGASWLFQSWSGNIDLGGAENDSSIDIAVGAANISLTATFIQGYSLTLLVEPGSSGTVDISPDQEYYASGSTVTLTSSPAVDYEFSGWTILGDDSTYTDDPFELTFGTSDLVVTAHFELRFTLEGEPDCGPNYVDTYNGGCNSSPEVFLPIENGQIYSGTSGTYLFGSETYRDTDWYEYIVTGDEDLRFFGEAEFPLQLFIINGTNGCASLVILDSDTTSVLGDTLNATAIVGPGTYWMWVGPMVFSGWDCPLGYTAWLDAQPTMLSEKTQPAGIDRLKVLDKQY